MPPNAPLLRRRSRLPEPGSGGLLPVEQKKKNKEVTEQQATVDVCDQLVKVGTALEASAALTPTSTVGEAEAAGQQLRTALKGLKQAETTLEEARLEAFQKQAQAFNKELKKVSKEKQLTLEEAAKTSNHRPTALWQPTRN